MKWRHWAVLIVLLLLNYIVFSTVFTQLAKQRMSLVGTVRTLQPTFDVTEANPVAWVVLPTCTERPSRTPVPPTPTPTLTPEVTAIFTDVTPIVASVTPTMLWTATPPPSPTTVVQSLIHVVKRGETLTEIARGYGVTAGAIIEANNLANPNHIVAGQKLLIPVSGQVVPTATTRPPATNTPKPKPTKRPATSTPTPPPSRHQFTAKVVWDPLVAPNCNGPAISRHSVIRNANGDPVNGVRIKVDCYGNQWLSHPSGNPGEYEPGHYDFSFGQMVPQDWTCSVWVAEINGQAVDSSEVISVHFDTNNCQPHGDGHQVAIVNWTKNW